MPRQTRKINRPLLAAIGVAVAVSAAGMGLYQVLRAPEMVSPMDDSEVLRLAGVQPGMSRDAARAVLLSEGWERGRPQDRRLATSGVMRAEEFFRRAGGAHSEAVGMDYTVHPSGEWVSTVHHAVMSGTVQVSQDAGQDDLLWIDDRFDQMRGELETAFGDPASTDKGRVDAWWMCCRDDKVAWANGVGVGLRYGYGFRMTTAEWGRDGLLAALDAEAEIGRNWSSSERMAVRGEGEAALQDLMERGALRRATHEDAQTWLAEHMSWAGPTIRQVSDGDPEHLRDLLGLTEEQRRGTHRDAYVVRAPLSGLPQGFADERPRQFLVPEDVPVPAGDLGRHQIYLMGGGVCRTGDGQCSAQTRVFDEWRKLRQSSEDATHMARY